jgi:putative flippase GtrA
MRERAKALYERHGEKLRFLVVGGWNTLFSIGVLWLLDHYIPYDQGSVIQKGLVLVVQWVIAVSQNFLTFKFLVFRSKGSWIREYLRIYVTYLATFVIQSVLTLTISGVFGLSVFWANLPTTFVVMIVSYVGHKHFTFRDAGAAFDEESS